MILVDIWKNLFSKPSHPASVNHLPSIYDFKIEDPVNPGLDFKKYKGKKVIIVNTASACSFTPQYRDFQKVFKKYEDKMVFLAFPCNDFGKQEILADDEIAEFCSVNFNVNYPIFRKINIKGSQPSPLFYWLSNSQLNGWNNRKPSWNFWKYILNEEGQLIAVLPSKYRITEETMDKWMI